MKTYDICACGCGCEPDGDWHWSQQPWCRCIANDCPCATDAPPADERPTVMIAPGRPDRNTERFALDADLTVYWPRVRPCWEETP